MSPSTKHRSAGRRRRPVLLACAGVAVCLAIGVWWWMDSRATSALGSGEIPPDPAASAAGGVERWRVQVLEELPHDAGLYTQGLELHGGLLYESSGLYGRSRLLRYRPGTEAAEVERFLDPDLFGEGLTLVGDRLVQLTWRERIAIVWTAEDLREVERLSYEGEGWGLCHDGHRLVMSDGSSTLVVRDPATFAVLDRIEVRSDGQSLSGLNELECAEGWIYANVYQTDSIARIDPVNGRVTALIDAGGLLTDRQRRRAEVLNGIAYEPSTETFYLTGKLWPRIFRVRFLATNQESTQS